MLKIPSSMRVRSAVIGVAVIALVLLQLMVVLIAGWSAHNDSIKVGRQAINRVGDTTIQSILRHVDPAEQSVGVTGRLLADGLVSEGDPELERYLYTQLAVMPQMTGAFVGYPDGSFVFVSRDSDGFRSKRIDSSANRRVIVKQYDSTFTQESVEYPTDDTYDPRTRPWYSLASSSATVEWTDPYVFFSSGQPGVTAGSAVRNAVGEVTAVVGVDVELSGLGEFLDDLPVARTGEAFVVSAGKVVAAPSSYGDMTAIEPDGTLRLSTIGELGVFALERGADGTVRSIDVNGEAELVLHRSFPDGQGLGWSVVVRAPVTDFVGEVSQQQRSVVFVLLGGGALILLVVLSLVRLTRPVKTLHDLASTDGLTGVANHRSAMERGAELMTEVERDDDFVAVLVIDLDGFKAVNDRLGHGHGDDVLRGVATYLCNVAGGSDVIGRLGGDEFVLFARADSTGAAVDRCERLLAGLSESLVGWGDGVVHLGASAGLTVAAGDALRSRTVDNLVAEADDALLAVKLDRKGALGVSSRIEFV